MFFSTFDPYIERDEIIYYKKSIQYKICNHENCEVNENNCFICYQIQKNDGKDSLKMNCITKYTKNCDCNLFIHISCLDEWFMINNDCPICRKKMTVYSPKNVEILKKVIYIGFHFVLYVLSVIYYYIMYIYLSIFILNIYNILKNK
jgi:hypothetical protein